jgi:hypothetical protein
MASTYYKKTVWHPHIIKKIYSENHYLKNEHNWELKVIL